MRIPENLHRHFEIIEENALQVQSLFKIPETPLKEMLIRKYAAPVVSRLPQKGRYLLTSMMKKMRNPSGELNLVYPMDFEECRIIAKGLEGTHQAPWSGKKAAVCICHDVDNLRGADYVPRMADINHDYRLPSTFNYLTHDAYTVEPAFVSSLLERGFEVGLHGYTHDQGFAFRRSSVIHRELDAALQTLRDADVIGYRSPALSLSDRLFRHLGRKGIRYDSSLQIGSPFYYSVRLPYPYYLEEYGIWEFPLMIQDDNYIRDTATSVEVALESVRSFIRDTILLNGICVINMHPHLMCDHEPFYLKFLDVLCEFDDIVCLRMKDILFHVEGNTDNGRQPGGHAVS